MGNSPSVGTLVYLKACSHLMSAFVSLSRCKCICICITIDAMLNFDVDVDANADVGCEKSITWHLLTSAASPGQSLRLYWCHRMTPGCWWCHVLWTLLSRHTLYGWYTSLPLVSTSIIVIVCAVNRISRVCDSILQVKLHMLSKLKPETIHMCKGLTCKQLSIMSIYEFSVQTFCTSKSPMSLMWKSTSAAHVDPTWLSLKW